MDQRSRDSLSADGPTSSETGADGPPHRQPKPLDAALAWSNAIRVRNGALGPSLTGDPAWNILLELYVQHCAGKSVSIASACVVSRVSERTTVRWLSVMAEAGLTHPVPDPSDIRHSSIGLTAAGVKKIEQALGCKPVAQPEVDQRQSQ